MGYNSTRDRYKDQVSCTIYIIYILCRLNETN